MVEPPTLVDVFVAHAGAPGDGARAPLAAALAALVAEAGRAWPGVAVDPAVFVRHVAERVRGAPDPARALRSLHGTDLYLACACASGDAAALQAFDEHVLAEVPPALGRSPVLLALCEEVQQVLRVRLFTTVDGVAPRIAEYTGRGSLVRWVQIAAVRQALNLRRGRKTYGEPQPEAELDLLSGGADPEIDYLKNRYGAELSAAFRLALASLSSRARTLLRLAFVDALTIDQIGACYRVHRATAARWLSAARATLLDETRRLLATRLDLPAAELDSLMRLVLSRVDVSLSRSLGERRGT